MTLGRRQFSFGLSALLAAGGRLHAQDNAAPNAPFADRFAPFDPAPQREPDAAPGPPASEPAVEDKPPAPAEGRTAGFEDRSVRNGATGRTIAIRIRMPAEAGKAGLIVYSPGLGSGISNGAHWCTAWQQAGFAVVTLAHPGTDDRIWDVGKRSFRDNMANALAASQYPQRVSDCVFVIKDCLNAFGDAIDPARIGVAGHSFGAFTVESLATQYQSGGSSSGAPQIKAAVALSPGGRTDTAAGRVSSIRIPFFCVTGDHDNHVTFRMGKDAMKLGVPLQNRIEVYRRLPKGAKQLLVLAHADHMTFAGERIDASQFSRDVPQSEDAKAWKRVAHATTAFWRHYLGPDPDDRQKFVEAVRAGLTNADRFEAA